MLKLDDGRKVLYQWDVGVTAAVLDDQITQVHFSNLSYGISYAVEVEGGKVLIPPEVLQSGADVYCWAYVSTNEKSYTKKDIVFNVVKRPKPTGYIYTPTDIETLESVKTELKGIVEQVTKHISTLYGEVIKKENVSNKTNDIDADRVSTELYTTEKAVYNFGVRIIDTHREEVNTQMNELEERLVSYIGGIENGSY